MLDSIKDMTPSVQFLASDMFYIKMKQVVNKSADHKLTSV